MKKMIALLLATSLIFLAACGENDRNSNNNGGGGGGGGGGIFSTGLPKDKKLKDLTEEETEKAEDAAKKAYNDQAFQSAMCNAIAVFGLTYSGDQIDTLTEEELRDGCVEHFNSCINDDSEDEEEDSGFPENCEATVGEIEACMPEMMADIKAAFAKVTSCDKLTADDVKNFDASILTAPALTPTCQAAEDKCPGLYTDSGQ